MLVALTHPAILAGFRAPGRRARINSMALLLKA
jgi:hypothetical protein